jgi:ADP-ribose pyrophosphatase
VTPPQTEEVLFQAQRFRVVRRWPPAEHGVPQAREVVVHPGAVAIVPLVDEQHVCLVRNYRVAVEETLLEIPAGTREPGEPPQATALRELEEETGYRAGQLEPLGALWMSPGILCERMWLFVARQLIPGQPRPDAGEHLAPLVVPYDQALRWVASGHIQDAKSVAALLLYDRHRRHPGSATTPHNPGGPP